MILGLDVSTTCTALAVVSDNNTIIDVKAIKFNKDLSIYEKAVEVKSKIAEVLEAYEIDSIYIEEPLMNFAAGGTTLPTLSTAQRFNGVISQYCYDLLKKAPIHLNATSARKLNNIKRCENPRMQHTKNIKPGKINTIESLTVSDPWYKITITSKGNVKAEEYDKADAIIIARAGLKLCPKQGNLKS